VAVDSTYQNRLANTTYQHTGDLFSQVVPLASNKIVASVILSNTDGLDGRERQLPGACRRHDRHRRERWGLTARREPHRDRHPGGIRPHLPHSEQVIRHTVQGGRTQNQRKFLAYQGAR
jgi:hypothetical protein